MNDNRLNVFLEEISLLSASYRAEKLKSGREFNVFSIQRIASDERRVCRFLRELLDPNGSHGQGDFFLRKFVDGRLQDISVRDYDYRHARVVCEETIDELRRIDIVIRIGRRLIPLEVKLFAKDQDKQCMDYYNYAVEIDPETKLYYLTLDGHEPNKESRGTLLDTQFSCLSFSKDIICWLDECIASKELEQVYPVREILIQFRNVIEDLIGEQGGKLSMQIKEKIEASYENVIAAMKIERALKEVKIDKMREVFQAIKNHLAEKGYKECVESYRDESAQYYTNHKKPLPSLNIILPIDNEAMKENLVLRFEIDHRLYCGVYSWNGNNNPDITKDDQILEYVKQHLLPTNTETEKDSSEWYWWKYLNCESDVNYRYCNQEYMRLFDKEFYTQYINDVFTQIDGIIKGME